MDRRSTAPFAGAGILLNSGLRDQLRLAWRLLRDPRVPAWKFILPALLALYVASPIDLIPDVFLGLGYTDDVGIAILIVVAVAKLIPKLSPEQVVAEHTRQMTGRVRAPHDQAATMDRVVDAQFNVHA